MTGMANKFDDFSKHLAQQHSRRGVLKILGAGVVASIGMLLRPGHTGEADSVCREACRGLSRSEKERCIAECKCSQDGREACRTGGREDFQCCPEGYICIGVNGTVDSKSSDRRGGSSWPRERCVPAFIC
jgi:hypothetical protein